MHIVICVVVEPEPTGSEHWDILISGNGDITSSTHLGLFCFPWVTPPGPGRGMDLFTKQKSITMSYIPHNDTHFELATKNQSLYKRRASGRDKSVATGLH